ncbi:hypothetical protein [Actinoplanes sp. N902-109]|uniref:hypothetical protein n=1 Tax=Actinoplanes sp. (strain N902-109) TaxID=649831 RepID=UPI0003295AD7|nr:hypothetical protein [Actinoplanes sp. N902-109]AGL20846.1 hypothetical protein L083_7336 [Actinoplanes sp. N902-109]
MTTQLLQRSAIRDGYLDEPEVRTRPQIIWHARFSIIGIAVLIAAATWATSAFLPGTYSASSDVLVANTSTMASVDVVDGANGLATQFAQFASTSVVLTDAAAKAGMPVGDLATGTLVGTVGNTNIIRITVTADSSAAASSGALAVGQALVDQAKKTMSTAAEADPEQLKDLDKLLTQAKSDVVRLTESLADAKAGSPRAASINTSLNSAQQQVLALTLKRLDIVSQARRDAGGRGVTLSLLTAQPTAAKVAPRPLLYSTVALVVSLVIMTELAVLSERRRNPIGRRRRSNTSTAGL